MTEVNNITVVIHARNVENNIEDCISSAHTLTDDIVVIDAQSTDTTGIRARKLGAAVYLHSPTEYVEPARTFDISKSTGPWIFVLDADERITKELAHEIRIIISRPLEYTHYRVPRKNIFAKKQWLRHGGWWPDYVSGRLLHKPEFIRWPSEIHSKPIMRGTEGTLRNPFIHYFHSSLESMVSSTIVYESIEAEMLYRAERKVDVLTFFRKFLGELFRRLVEKMGFMDGQLGIIESIYQAYSKTVTWILLYEKKYQHSN